MGQFYTILYDFLDYTFKHKILAILIIGGSLGILERIKELWSNIFI